MKAILEFNLPEDNQEYLITVKANDMANFIFDIEQGIDITFQKIYELLEKHKIDIDELID